MTSAPNAGVPFEEATLLQCQFCPVKFGGSPTDPRTLAFRARHEKVNHNITRVTNLREAAKRTERRLAAIQRERAEKVAARTARLAVAKAARPTKYRPTKIKSIPKAKVK